MTKKNISNRTFVITAAIGSALITVILILNTLWASRQTIKATDEAVSAVSSFYLNAMANRRAKTITNLINNNFDQMEKAVDVIRDEEIETQEELRSSIGMIKSLLSLSRFALVDEDNVVYTQYTTYTGGSRHEFLAEGELNGRTISTVYLYGSSKQLCLAIPADFKAMGKSIKACFVQIDIRDIVNLLAFDDDQESTNFGLYSKNGGNLSGTELGPAVSDKNIFDITKGSVPEKDWLRFVDDFARERAGSLNFTVGDTKETLCYEPVQNTGWELVVLIRDSVIRDQIHSISEQNLSITKYQLTFTLIVTAVFASILLLEARIIARKKLEAEQENSRNLRSMATTDSLTGVGNKHAFSEAELELNPKIMAHEIDKLAIVVCDINGLKHVNDTLGHAAGDQLIRDASDLISRFFVHGSVYRIGGDEFTVLLQGEGYDTMQTVIDRFNRTAEENIRKDAVVVSIGYAVLDPSDEQLHDLLKRADQMMYERKRALKQMGAKTRD